MFQVLASLIERGVPPEKLIWLRLDHPLLQAREIGWFVNGAIKRRGPGLTFFLDELTYAEHWDLWLKTFYDEHLPIDVFASSSASAALRDRRVESGVGRWREVFLAPYSFDEYLKLRGHAIEPPQSGATLDEAIRHAISHPERYSQLKDEREKFLLIGGFPQLLELAQELDFPEAVLRSQRTLREDAMGMSVYKDIPQAFRVDEPAKLERLIYVIAGQIGGLMSPQSLGATLGLAAPTVDRYVSYLQESYLVFTLQNYSRSEETVQRRGKKVYFFDGSMRNAALHRGLRPMTDPAEMGSLIENSVAAHLEVLARQAGYRLFHWRNKKTEVDFVLDIPDQPFAFEVSASINHSMKGLIEFQTRYPKFKGSCYFISPGVEPSTPEQNEDGIGRIPLDTFLVTIGQQAASALSASFGRLPA